MTVKSISGMVALLVLFSVIVSIIGYRTFTSALLECLMGATADEVVADYMETYINYYGLEKGTEKYDAVVNSNIVKTLAAAFGVEDIFAADLAAEARAFVLEELGLSQNEVDALMSKLGK